MTQLVHAAGDQLDQPIRNVFLHEQQSQRRAALACGRERRGETSSATCSSSAEESTIIALMPPVSAISGTIAPSRAASARLMN